MLDKHLCTHPTCWEDSWIVLDKHLCKQVCRLLICRHVCSLTDTFLEFFSNRMTVNFDELYSIVKDMVGRYMMATLLSQYNLTGYKYSILSYINKFFNQVWSDLITSTSHRSILCFCWGARNCCLFLSLPRYGQPPKKDTIANDSLSSASTMSPKKFICAISRWVMSSDSL